MPSTLRIRPDATEYPSFYAGYIASVPADDILIVLRKGRDELAAAFGQSLAAAGTDLVADKPAHHRAADGAKAAGRTFFGNRVDRFDGAALGAFRRHRRISGHVFAGYSRLR